MLAKKAIGVHGSSALSFVDHLVPLCQIMSIPLFCVDPWIYEVIDLYYPSLTLFTESPRDYCLDPFLNDYEALFFVSHSKKCKGAYLIGDYLLNSNAKGVYSLHGNSDKKRNVFWIENAANEDIFLLYGQHMQDFIQEKGIYERIPKIIPCGNYRLAYYLKNKDFFLKKISPFLFPNNGKKTILYAPTWSSPNQKTEWRVDYSSFFNSYPYVLNNIPEDFQVYVKMHPYMVELYPSECFNIRERYEDSPQIRFVDSLPLIYPLLEYVDLYLGDYSSIGYDFLYFNRPLFFINSENRKYEDDKGVFLYQCGAQIFSDDLPNLYQHLEKKEDPFEEIRQKTYTYAFFDISLENLKKDIESALCDDGAFF